MFTGKILLFAGAATLALTAFSGSAKAADAIELSRPSFDHDGGNYRAGDLSVIPGSGHTGPYGSITREQALILARPEVGHSSAPVWNRNLPQTSGNTFSRETALELSRPETD